MNFDFDPRFWGLAPIILLSFTTEAMTGFGSIVIAVTIGANFFPIKELLPVLVPLNILLSGYIVWRHHRHIDRGLLFHRILPWCGIGVLIGLSLFRYAEGIRLKRAFGLLVAGTVCRVVLPVFTGEAAVWLIASQIAWIAAFAIFVRIYAPILTRPRIDGRPD